MPGIVIDAKQPNPIFSVPQDIECKIEAPGKIPNIPPGYVDMRHPLSYLGIAPEKIKDITSLSFTLADTTFSAWSASTTASKIWDYATTVSTGIIDTVVITPATHDYIIIWDTTVEVAYETGATLKAMPFVHKCLIFQEVARYPSTLANAKIDNYNAQNVLAVRTEPWLYYYNTSGNKALVSTSYGIYPASVAAIVSSSTAASPTLNLKPPTFSARCNSNYFATARKAEVSLNNTHIKIEGTVWSVDPATSVKRRMTKDTIEALKPYFD